MAYVDRDGSRDTALSSIAAAILINAIACAMVGRCARFAAARGPDGAPIAGHYAGRVSWRAPAD